MAFWVAPAVSAGVQLLGGFFGSRSARKAAEAKRQQMEAYASGLRGIGENVEGGYNTFGQNMFGLAEEAGDRYQFTPFAVRSGFGSAQLGPEGFSTTLSPEYADLRGRMLGGASDLLGQAQAFDTQGYAQNMFQQLQGLAQPARQEQLQSAARMLHKTGGMGLGSNTEGNLMMRGLGRGFSQQDAQMALQAQQMAGTEQDRAMARAYGMLAQGVGIDNLNKDLFSQFQGVQQLAQPFQMRSADQYFNYMGQGYQAPLQGMLSRAGYESDALRVLTGGNVDAIAERNAATQGRIRGFTNAAQQIIPLGSSMFGGGPVPSTNYGTLDPGSYTGWRGPW